MWSVPGGIVPLIFDLGGDPGGLQPHLREARHGMMFVPVAKSLIDYKLSTVPYPNIKPGEEFKGYRGAKHLLREGEFKYAEHELHAQAAS